MDSECKLNHKLTFIYINSSALSDFLIVLELV